MEKNEITEKLKELRAGAEAIRGSLKPKSITPEMVGGTLSGLVDSLSAILSMIKAGLADWTAPETEAGFIHNKPFTYKAADFVTVAPDGVEHGETDGLQQTCWHASMAADGSFGFEAGAVYEVDFEGYARRVCTAYTPDDTYCVMLADVTDSTPEYPLGKQGTGNWAVHLREVAFEDGQTVRVLNIYAAEDFVDRVITIRRVTQVTPLDEAFIPRGYVKGLNTYNGKSVRPDESGHVNTGFGDVILEVDDEGGVSLNLNPTGSAASKEYVDTKGKEAAFKEMVIRQWNDACKVPNRTMGGHYIYGKYDVETDSFTLGRFSFTLEEAFRALNNVRRYFWSSDCSGANAGLTDVKVFPPMYFSSGVNATNAFGQCRAAQVMAIVGYNDVSACSPKLNGAFNNCQKLVEILGVIHFTNTSGELFTGCKALERVNMSLVKNSIDISGAPLLSLESFQYLVANAANTAAITVTVHSDVYAKFTDEGNAEWHKVLTDALERNISFATT